MGELADEWSAHDRPNLWGQVPRVVEMQSEAGAAGALHGALLAGALATTFTASQGLLLMIPDMYKIAGELTPFVMHVAARTLATHALSIFGDHSDVMACRQTGFAMLCAGSVQEAHDFAAIAHAATLEARVPFMHFFDGFRTSHELAKIEMLDDATLRGLLDHDAIARHHARAMTPDRPSLRGTAHNPDTYFQAREAVNPFYDACSGIVGAVMERFAVATGRRYQLFDYAGHPEAERVIVIMGSGSEIAHETVDHLVARGERVGVLKVRLYRPFDARALLAALPRTTQAIAVLDRTKEPGAVGDPLWLDVVAALAEARRTRRSPFAAEPVVVAGRYGLSSKELTPAMLAAVYAELAAPEPRSHFTLGIEDDVTHRSLPYDRSLRIEVPDVVRAVIFGLGSDGTVGSNKNTVKIVGEDTPLFPQGYFVYDSRKSGSVTISHLRFSPRPIRSSYLVDEANLVACHHLHLFDRLDIVELAGPGAMLLVNAPSPADLFARLPAEVQTAIVDKGLRVFAIDAVAVADEAGLGKTIGTVMQTCLFLLTGLLDRDLALAAIKREIERTYGKRGDVVVRRNHAAVDLAATRLVEVPVPAVRAPGRPRPPILAALGKRPPTFVEKVTAVLMAGKGDQLPVSAFPIDGTWPTGTAVWEKRSIARSLPQWDPAVCIQCNKCALICPHAAIRTKVFDRERLAAAPSSVLSTVYKAKDHAGAGYVVQVAPDDCTGCGLCVAFCPAKDKSNPRHKAIDMVPAQTTREVERERWAFVSELPAVDRRTVHLDIKGSQLLEPLFEFSGACSGCGETPYVKLVSQLFGDRAVIANATGCSSIYGGNLPTTPWTTDAAGRGPAWANSLFEDNAEVGLGMRLAIDAHRDHARALLSALASAGLGSDLVAALLAPHADEAALHDQRARVVALRTLLAGSADPRARELDRLADYLVDKSVWIMGGDGWAYDIGYGGLDHVLASGANVNVLVLDTEGYSNTGGQQSKATPTGASAKFASAGKQVPKKDLGLLAMSYGHVYVARVALGAKDKQTLDAVREAESWHGPSLVIAYSHCIAHGYDLSRGADQQRLAVDAGVWPLYRYDPRRTQRGEPALVLDAVNPGARSKIREYMRNEGRFRVVELQDPKRFESAVEALEHQAAERLALYQRLAEVAPRGGHAS